MKDLPGIILNFDPKTRDRETYIVFGNPRGGTTMIANILTRFKIFMGDDLRNNLEDNLFNIDYLRRTNKDLSNEQLINIIRENLKFRNDQNKVWGWKYPRSSFYLEDIHDDLINPKFICVFRDPFAVARRNIFRLSKDPCNTIKEATKLALKNISYIENAKQPSLICSYENVLSNPLEFIKLINKFIGNPISDENDLKVLCEAINPSYGYTQNLN